MAESYWSALTRTPVDGPDADNPALDDPVLDALLMGGGSIGGATSYTFGRVPRLGGRLIVCDPQRLEDRNSLKALMGRHRANKLVRRRGRVYIINKVDKRYKARQG